MKVALILLISILLNSNLKANELGFDDGKALAPHECLGVDGCWCYTKAANDNIARGLVELQSCNAQLALANEIINRQDLQTDHWYDNPNLVIGGTVLSISVGMIIGGLLIR